MVHFGQSRWDARECARLYEARAGHAFHVHVAGLLRDGQLVLLASCSCVRDLGVVIHSRRLVHRGLLLLLRHHVLLLAVGDHCTRALQLDVGRRLLLLIALKRLIPLMVDSLAASASASSSTCPSRRYPLASGAPTGSANSCGELEGWRLVRLPDGVDYRTILSVVRRVVQMMKLS